jgi:hypothetical protein
VNLFSARFIADWFPWAFAIAATILVSAAIAYTVIYKMQTTSQPI